MENDDSSDSGFLFYLGIPFDSPLTALFNGKFLSCVNNVEEISEKRKKAELRVISLQQ